jgi:hypothetical protein
MSLHNAYYTIDAQREPEVDTILGVSALVARRARVLIVAGTGLAGIAAWGRALRKARQHGSREHGQAYADPLD